MKSRFKAWNVRYQILSINSSLKAQKADVPPVRGGRGKEDRKVPKGIAIPHSMSTLSSQPLPLPLPYLLLSLLNLHSFVVHLQALPRSGDAYLLRLLHVMQASGIFMARRAWATGDEKEKDRTVMTNTSKTAPAQPKDQCDILGHFAGDPRTSLQELHLSLTALPRAPVQG